MSSAVFRPALPGDAQRLQNGSLGARVAEMRSRDHHGAGRSNKVWVDVVFAERHVGAVLAVEDQRKSLAVADSEEDERRQPLRIDHHAPGFDTFARELLEDEAAHMLVAHAGDQSALQPQPGRAAGDVRRRTADVLVERPHVLQPAADLGAVEVHARPADRDDVERLHVHFPCQKPVRRRKSRLAARSARMPPELRGSRSCSMVM